MKAYKLVKANAGAAGVDKQSLEGFEINLKDNLFKLWNRLSSGSYFPPPIKGVPIPKKSGGIRLLGVPTVGDRIAQMVIKLNFEPQVEPYFLTDSYGYRPGKSALDAVGITRQRCWKYDWLIEFDIKGLFDNIPRNLLMKAVRKHTKCKWTLLYIERWLNAPMQISDGETIMRQSGTPQGSVISPVLSNLFMHYVFDLWLQRHYPSLPWCRYADDGLVHCRTEKEAREILANLDRRFQECGLQLHPDKTRIVYCKDGNRKSKYKNTTFEFLGFAFRPRLVKANKGYLFVSFTPSASEKSLKSMHDRIKWIGKRRNATSSLNDIAENINPVIRGWINYYGKYNRSGLYPIWRDINKALVKWAMRKFKKLNSKTKAARFIKSIAISTPGMLAHWKEGMQGAFA